MRFPSIARVALEDRIKFLFRDKHFDRVLYVGVLSNTYRSLINCNEFVTMDIDSSLKPDVVGDVMNMPFRDNSFDCVVMFEVLEHLSNPFMAVDEVYRVLKPSGFFFGSVPFLKHYHGSPFDFFRFTDAGVISLCRKFTSKNVWGYGNKLSLLYQTVSVGRFMRITKFQGLMNVFSKFVLLFDSSKSIFRLGYVFKAEK